MSRKTLAYAALAVVILVAVWAAISAGWFGRILEPPTAGVLPLAGDVRSDVRAVTAPAITFPTADYTVGIPIKQGTGTAGGSPATAKKSSPAGSGSGAGSASRTPVVAGM